jgi:hypothetical protein
MFLQDVSPSGAHVSPSGARFRAWNAPCIMSFVYAQPLLSDVMSSLPSFGHERACVGNLPHEMRHPLNPSP